MFTGIIECLGTIIKVEKNQTNLDVWIKASFTSELKVDQSVAHNGVCLTVVAIEEDTYKVTAIDETLQKTNLGYLKVGDEVNLERCMVWGGRLDGHIVQGHVDCTATCVESTSCNGSWKFGFQYASSEKFITIPKGSICVNGVSLTVVESKPDYFSVAIIPYTFEHTNFKNLKVGDTVNLEFDVLGKYIFRYLDAYKQIIK